MAREAQIPSARTQRNDILDSALKVFAEKGFEGATLREIGTRAHANHAMIKYYFGSKSQLWDEAVQYLFDRQRDELEPANTFSTHQNDPKATLALFCKRLIQYSARHPEHGRLIAQASMTPGPRLDSIMAETRRNHDLFKEHFGGDESLASSTEGLMILYIIVGACQTAFNLEHEIAGLYDVDVSQADFVERFTQVATSIFTEGLFAHAQPVDNPSLQSTQTAEGLEIKILIPNDYRA